MAVDLASGFNNNVAVLCRKSWNLTGLAMPRQSLVPMEGAALRRLEPVYDVNSVAMTRLVFSASRLLPTEFSGRKEPIFGDYRPSWNLGNMKWEAAERRGDVGIYRRLTTGLGMDFDKGLERLVDEAILKRSRELERLHEAKTERRPKTKGR